MAEADCGARTIAVHRGAWTDPDVAAMVAPPVIVSAAPVVRRLDPWRRRQMGLSGSPRRPEDQAPVAAQQLARARANMPVSRHRRRSG